MRGTLRILAYFLVLAEIYLGPEDPHQHSILKVPIEVRDLTLYLYTYLYLLNLNPIIFHLTIIDFM